MLLLVLVLVFGRGEGEAARRGGAGGVPPQAEQRSSTPVSSELSDPACRSSPRCEETRKPDLSTTEGSSVLRSGEELTHTEERDDTAAGFHFTFASSGSYLFVSTKPTVSEKVSQSF